MEKDTIMTRQSKRELIEKLRQDASITNGSWPTTHWTKSPTSAFTKYTRVSTLLSCADGCKTSKTRSGRLVRMSESW